MILAAKVKADATYYLPGLAMILTPESDQKYWVDVFKFKLHTITFRKATANIKQRYAETTPVPMSKTVGTRDCLHEGFRIGMEADTNKINT
jgi:hypothetical protein